MQKKDKKIKHDSQENNAQTKENERQRKTLKETQVGKHFTGRGKKSYLVSSENNCKQEENWLEKSFERETITDLEFCSQRNSLQM